MTPEDLGNLRLPAPGEKGFHAVAPSTFTVGLLNPIRDSATHFGPSLNEIVPIKMRFAATYFRHGMAGISAREGASSGSCASSICQEASQKIRVSHGIVSAQTAFNLVFSWQAKF